MDKRKFNGLLSALKRDKNAIEELYEFYFPKIVMRLTAKYQDLGKEFAEDVAQDFFFRLYRQRHELGHIEYPTSWVYGICENLAKRKRKRINFNDLPLSKLAENASDSEVSIDSVQVEIACADTAELLNRLNEEERNIVFDHIWQGFSLKEIALRSGRNYNTVKQKYRRSLGKIKTMMK